MQEELTLEINGKEYDLLHELSKVENGAMWDEIIKFIGEAHEDSEKRQALINYLTELDDNHTFNDKLFEGADYYDLLAKYEDIQEAAE